MKILLRVVALLFTAIAVFLIAAVINAVSSDAGARPAVAVGYVAASLVLAFLALRMWLSTLSDPAGPEQPPPPPPPA
jgi:membrane protease YdiL (CAAX protease family)